MTQTHLLGHALAFLYPLKRQRPRIQLGNTPGQ